MLHRCLSYFVIVLISFSILILPIKSQATPNHLQQPNYSLWASILDTHVNNQGRVNYAILKNNRSKLDNFVEQIKLIHTSQLNPIEQKAFWINAYNALTLQTVINNYPVSSIRHINFGLVWKLKKEVASGKYSLEEIEHQILRPLGDPRVHFALNCASIGCPKLPKKPFYPDTLDAQLEAEARRFMNDPEKVRLDKSTNTLYHSELLNWYEDDFLIVSPNKLSYITQYLNEDDRHYLQNHRVILKKIKYDWGLNKQ